MRPIVTPRRLRLNPQTRLERRQDGHKKMRGSGNSQRSAKIASRSSPVPFPNGAVQGEKRAPQGLVSRQGPTGVETALRDGLLDAYQAVLASILERLRRVDPPRAWAADPTGPSRSAGRAEPSGGCARRFP